MRKTLRYLLFSVLIALTAVSFIACGDNKEPEQPITPAAATYSIAFSAENEERGSVSCKDANGAAVSSGAKFEKDTALTVTATANTGYTFDGWYNGTNKVGETAEYSFNMPESDLTLVAKFTVNGYAFTYSSEDTAKGTVACDITSGADVAYKTSVTVTATANTGYSFDGWYDGTEKVSANAEYVFSMPAKALTVEAKFTINNHKLSYSVNAEQGSIECETATDTDVEYNTSITITATANDGYTFADWFDGEQVVNTAATYTFPMPDKALTLTARFTVNSYAFTYSSEDTEKGTVVSAIASGTNVEYKTNVTVTATANEGYTFDGWYNGTEKVSPAAEYSFPMPTSAVTLQARFTVNSYAFTYSSEDTEKGTVVSAIASGTNVEYKTNVTVTATANDGYTFDGWYNGTEKVSLAAEYTFPMPTSAVTLQARFTINSNAFTYTSEDTEKGTVESAITSGDSVAYNTSVTVTATANTGYTFDGWYNGTEKVSPAATYTFPMPDNAVTLTARFIPQKRTVNFYVDSDVIETKEVDYNTAAPTDSVNAEKANNEFIGWFTDPEFKNVYGGEPVTSTLDLYAKFNPITVFFTVRFFDYDGSQIGGNQKIKQGNKPSTPADQERTGYDFTGWTFNNTPFTDEVTVESDMDIYATYTEKEYQVRFYLEKEDGLGEEYDIKDVKHGKTVAKPTTPTKSDYTFIKWKLNDYDFDFTMPITDNLEIYAEWKEVEKATFTVTFYGENGVKVIDTQTVEEGGDATAPQIPEMEGKTFKAWSGEFTNVTENIDIYATYETATCKVTFAYYSSSEGKDVETEVTVDYGTAADAPTNTEKTGYTFDSWDIAFSNVTEDIKVTAIYTIKTFTATFHIGDDEYDDHITPKKANYGETFQIPTTPVVAGYSFMGWFSDDACTIPFRFTDTATKNVDIYGKLQEIQISTYTVKFVDGDRTISEQTVVEHEAASAPGDPSRTGYTFTGWDIAFTNVTENITVTAQYIKNKYTVTYFEEDGTTLIGSEEVEYQNAATKPYTAAELAGKTFSDWSKDLTSITKNIEVSAVYVKNSVIVRFMDGETELSTQSVEYDGHASVPSTPVKQGYIFKAWVVEAGSDEVFDFNTAITAETEIFAKWEQASGVYSVYFKKYDGESYGNVQRVVAGYYATEPSIPAITDPDREFDGWYIEGTNEIFDFEHTQIFSTITLVAKDRAKTTD